MYDKVTVRHQEPDDYEGLQALMSQPRVIQGTLQLPLPPKELWKQRANTPLPGHYRLVAEFEGQIVGNIGLHPELERPRRRHVASLGMCVHDDFQGKGVGQKLMESVVDIADNWLNLTRLELTVFTDNEGAIRLYERMGFEREGVMRRYAYRDGAYVDALAMARLR